MKDGMLTPEDFDNAKRYLKERSGPLVFYPYVNSLPLGMVDAVELADDLEFFDENTVIAD